MNVSIKTIDHIAKLAKLKFDPEESIKFAEEFSHILNHIDNIEREDLQGIDEGSFENPVSVFREDVEADYGFREELFINTRQMKDDFFVIPKVID